MDHNNNNKLPAYKGIDQTGKMFGHWKVLKFAEWDYVHYNHRWLCLCTSCNKEFEVVSSSLTLGKSRSCVYCCALSGEMNGNWKGYKNIPGEVFYKVEYFARKRSMDFSISIEYLNDLWEESKGLCALSGMPIKLKSTASLDRIDSMQGYIKGNLQWVHKTVNRMKNNFPQEEFISICKKISNYKDKLDEN